jgi:hypothetical protein
VHDRRIEGMTLTCGNQGGLFMNAMTWWDHETRSVWSQPWGRALKERLKDVVLAPIPAQVTTWGSFRADHPDALVLTATDSLGERYEAELPLDDFVIGIEVDGDAVAVRYRDASDERVINERAGDEPIVIFADAETRTVRVFSRDTASGVLTFNVARDGSVTDTETGSGWDLARGIALEGPLKGTRLSPVPYVTAFDWAWSDFWPESRLVGGLNAPEATPWVDTGAVQHSIEGRRAGY